MRPRLASYNRSDKENSAKFETCVKYIRSLKELLDLAFTDSEAVPQLEEVVRSAYQMTDAFANMLKVILEVCSFCELA